MMAMTFEAPVAMVGNETPVLAVFDGNESAVVQEEATPVLEPIADGDGMTAVEMLPSEEWAAGSTEQPVDSAEDDTFWKEIELLGELSEAERERQSASSKYLWQKELATDAKKLLALKELALQEVASKIADLMAGKTLPSKSPELESKSPEQITGACDDSWRDIPTRELLTGVKGLGAKKLESLCDVAPTAGKLEDLRATSNGVFKSVLPNGFGDKVASAIEDALLEAQKPPAGSAAEQVEPRVEKVDIDATGFEPLPLFGQLTDTAEKIAATNDWDKFRKQIETTNDLASYDLEDCEIGGDDSTQFADGFNAFQANEPVHYCDADTYDGQADWVMGWCVAKQHEKLTVQAEMDEEDTDESINDL